MNASESNYEESSPEYNSDQDPRWLPECQKIFPAPIPPIRTEKSCVTTGPNSQKTVTQKKIITAPTNLTASDPGAGPSSVPTDVDKSQNREKTFSASNPQKKTKRSTTGANPKGTVTQKKIIPGNLTARDLGAGPSTVPTDHVVTPNQPAVMSDSDSSD